MLADACLREVHSLTQPTDRVFAAAISTQTYLSPFSNGNAEVIAG